MRIALFTETYLPFINGVVTHVKTLKQGLEKEGHTVLIVTADTKIKKHYIKNGVLYCPSKNIKKFYNYGLAHPLSHKRLKLVKEFNPDIIHIHTEFGIGLSGALIAKTLKIPLVYTLHTMYDDYVYYIAPKPLIPFVTKVSHKYEKFLTKSAAALIGPSKKVENYIRKCGIDKPVEVVPNTVELDLFYPDNIDSEKRKEFRKQYNIYENDTLVCFCGRLGKEKSVDELIEFWHKKVKPEDNLKLLIIGDGPDKDELYNQVKNCGMDNIIKFTGKVNHDDIPAYYSCCDLYITASLTEVNSISMLEAMATGLPVVHRFDKLNQGQVTEGLNGYIFYNENDMYEKLISYRDKTPEEKRQIKQSVYNSIRNSGAENLAEYILTIYEQSENNHLDKIKQKKRLFKYRSKKKN